MWPFTCNGGASFLRIIGWLLLAVLLLATLIPWSPRMINATLDPSWFQAISYAKAHNFVFGRDLVYTYGPLISYLSPFSWYAGGNHVAAIFIYCIYCLIAICAFARIARQQPGTSACVAGSLFFLGLCSSNEALFFCIPLLLLANFRMAIRPPVVLSLLLISACAFMTFAKATWGILTLGLLLILDGEQLFRHKRIPLYLPSFLALAVVTFVLSGQPLQALGGYVVNTWRIVSGYSEAMHFLPSTSPFTEVAVYLAGSSFLVGGLFSAMHDKTFRSTSAGFSLGLLAILFMAFKAGFARPNQQMGIAFGTLITTAAVVLSLHSEDRVVRPLKVAAVCAALLGLVGTAMVGATQYQAELFRPRLGGIPTALRTMPRFLGKDYRHDLEARLEQRYQLVRDQFPLPKLDGSVDIFPWNTTIVVAHGLDYRPRPAFQSYTAYTPELLDLNRNFMTSTQAPDYIVFDVAPIDGRFPSLDDSVLWPILLTHYELYTNTDHAIILKKARLPLDYSFLQNAQAEAEINQWVFLPDSVTDLTWTRITIEKTFFGRLLSTLFQPPLITMSVRFDDDTESEYRIVPGIARSGFLLSPFINSRADFATLFLDGGTLLAQNKDMRVKAVRINAGRMDRLAYRQVVQFVFSDLLVPSLKDRVHEADTSAWWWQEMGLEYYHRGHLGMALTSLKRSMQADDSNTDVIVQAMLLQALLGQWSDVQRLSAKALRLEKDNWSAIFFGQLASQVLQSSGRTFFYEPEGIKAVADGLLRNTHRHHSESAE